MLADVSRLSAAGDAIILEHARIEVELELGRVRRIKLALIDRASALGSLDAPKHFPSAGHEVRWSIAMNIWMMEKNKGRRPRWPKLKDPSATMPPLEPQRSSEAARGILPDLAR